MNHINQSKTIEKHLFHKNSNGRFHFTALQNVCVCMYICIYIYIYTYIYALHKNYKVFSNVTYGQVWLGT